MQNKKLAGILKDKVTNSIKERGRGMEYNVLDLFGGAGGFSEGFKQAGFNIVGAVEWDKHAMESHQANFPNTVDHLGDITEISDEEVLSLWGNKGVDVIISGPSCQSFSNANRTEDPYGETARNRNRLFFEVLRFTKLLNPEIVVIENVPQILTRDKGAAKETIKEYLADLGYTTTYQNLLASEYGVPEHRRRAIFVGVRGNRKFDFDTMNKQDMVTVKEALSDLYDAQTYSAREESNTQSYPTEPQSDYQAYMRRQSEQLTQHTVANHNKKVIERLDSIPQGGNWQDIPSEFMGDMNFHPSRTHSNNYRRLHEDEPSHTLTSKLDQGHPIHPRRISIREGARLQSFPDHFIFKGPRTKQALQIGNAVPPLLARALAEGLMQVLKTTEAE